MTLIAVTLVGAHSLPDFIASLAPNAAVVLATAGLGLIFFELNRPGRIVPGCLGLVTCLLALSSLSHHVLRPAAALLILVALATLLLNVWRPIPLWLAIAPTAALAGGLIVLFPGRARISLSVALTCGLAVGLLSTALSRIAFRARRLKAVH